MLATELISKVASFIAMAGKDVEIQLVIEDHDGFDSRDQRVGDASFALYGGYDGEPVRIVSRNMIAPPVPFAPRERKKCPCCENGFDPFEDDGKCTTCGGTGTVWA